MDTYIQELLSDFLEGKNREVEKALKKNKPVIISGPLHAGKEHLYEKIKKSFAQFPVLYVEYGKTDIKNILNTYKNSLIILVADNYLNRDPLDSFKKDSFELRFNIPEKEAENIIRNKLKDLDSFTQSLLEKYGIPKALVDHARFNNTVIPLILIENIETYIRSVEVLKNESIIKDIRKKVDSHKKERDLIIGAFGLESSEIAGFALDLTGYLKEAVKVAMPFIGMAVPVALIGLSSYEFYKKGKEAKQSYYDQLIRIRNHWDHISEVEKEMIGYLSDKKNNLEPGKGKEILDKMLSGEEALRKNIDELSDKFKELLENNTEIRSIFEEHQNDLNNLRNDVLGKINKLETEIDSLRREFDSFKSEFEELKGELEYDKNKIAGSEIITNTNALKESLAVKDEPVSGDETDKIIMGAISDSDKKLSFITGEPGAGKTTILYQIGKKLIENGKKLYLIKDIGSFDFLDFLHKEAYAFLDINNIYTADKLFEKIELIINNPDVDLHRLIISSRYGFISEALKKLTKEHYKEYPVRHSDKFLKKIADELLKDFNPTPESIEELVKKAESIPLYISEASKMIKESGDPQKTIAELPKGIKDLTSKIVDEEIKNDPLNLILYYLVSHYPFFPDKLYEETLYIGKIEKKPKYIDATKKSISIHPWYKDIIEELIKEDEITAPIKKDSRLKEIKEKLSQAAFPDNRIPNKFKKEFSEFIKNISESSYVPIIDIIDSYIFLAIRNFIKNNFRTEEDKYGVDIFEKRLDIKGLDIKTISVYANFSGFISNYYFDGEIIADLKNNKRPLFALSVFYISRFIQGKTIGEIENNIFGDVPVFLGMDFLFNGFLNGTNIVRNYISLFAGILYGIKYYDDSYINEANYNIFFKNYKEAVELCDKAIESGQNNALACEIKGFALLKLKRYEEAIECYDKAIELDPNDAGAYNGKGNALLNLKRYEEAIECYDKAIELDPNYVPAYNGKGLAFANLKRYEEAIEYYDKAIELDPNYVYAYHGKGFALASLKRYEEAIECYDNLIELDPNYAYAYNNKGIVIRKFKRYEEAIECYDKAIELDPNDADAYNNKGNALRDLKRYEEAIECYDKAIELDPNYVQAYNNKGIVLEDLKRYEDAIKCYDNLIELDPNYVNAYNLKGNVLRNLKRYEEAIECYDNLIELDPNYAYAYNNKGIVIRKFKRYEEAIECYDKAIELDPNYVQAYNNKGIVIRKLKRYEEAIECYDKAIELDPNYVPAYNGKGLAFANLKRYEEAIECYDKMIDLDPNYALAYNNKGIALSNLKRYEEAIECYDDAIDLDPNNASAYYNKGIVLSNLERYDEAIECYDKAIGLDPNYALAYYNKGNVLINLKRYEEAIECYDNAIELDPNYAFAYNAKAFVFLNLKRYEEAIELSKKALELNPNSASFYDTLGNILYELNRNEEAIFELDKAIEIDPNLDIAHFNKAKALFNLERYHESIEILDRAIELDNSNDEYKELKERILKNLEG